MKTTKLIFALSLALIFAMGSTNMYAMKSSKRDLPIEKARMIAYVVRIENMNFIDKTGNHLLVMMTDENGRQVAPAQTFNAGKSDYTFLEGGTIRGTRVARVVRLPITPHSPEFPPTSKTGIFFGGASYLFIIKPIPVSGDTGTNKN